MLTEIPQGNFSYAKVRFSVGQDIDREMPEMDQSCNPTQYVTKMMSACGIVPIGTYLSMISSRSDFSNI